MFDDIVYTQNLLQATLENIIYFKDIAAFGTKVDSFPIGSKLSYLTKHAISYTYLAER